MQATRSKPRCKEDCTQHIFNIKNNNGNSKLDVNINFCPKFRRDPHPLQKTIPEFNLDKRYYTQAFIIGTQLKSAVKNAQQQQMHFQTMIKDACQKNNQIVFPRPNEKNSYCSVCKQHYKVYYEHINTQSHKIKIDAAVYNSQIKRLCNFYQEKWHGAHEEADKIITDLFRQNQLYQQGITKDIQDNQNNQEQDEVRQQGSEQQIDGQNEKNVQENQEQQQEVHEQQDQQIDQQKGLQQKEDQNNLQADQQQNQNSPQPNINQKTKKQSLQNQNQNQNKQIEKNEVPVQQKKQTGQPTLNNPPAKDKIRVNQNFFDTGSSPFVVFLQKNKNGKYQVVKQVQKRLKADNKAMIENRLAKQLRLLATQQRIVSKSKQLSKISKQSRQIYRVKPPTKNKLQESQYNHSSNLGYQSPEEDLCKALKQKIQKDRIKTRKQRQQQQQYYQPAQLSLKYKNQKSVQKHQNKKQNQKQKKPEQIQKSKQKEKQKIKQKEKDKQKQKEKQKQKQKQKEKEKDKNKNKEKQKQKQKEKQKSKQKEKEKEIEIEKQKSNLPPKYVPPPSYPHIYGNPSSLYPNFQNRTSPINTSRSIPSQQKMPMHPGAIYMHPSMQMPPPSHIASKTPHGIPRMNMNGAGSYMPPPGSMMMNPSLYFNNMMPYGMPMRNQNTSTEKDNPKQRPSFPLYYPPPTSWNPYMMPPHSMVRPSEGSIEKGNSLPRPPMPNPYMYVPPPPSNMPKSTSAGNPPSMPPNMPMYMPYPMDSRYSPFMGYEYMPKKPQQQKDSK